MKTRATLLALLLFTLAAYLPGQISLPPFDRDEARFAQASKQMVESGDYVDIRFQDEHRYKKPIGIYWLQSAAANITGATDKIWPYRIPSWLGAMGAVMLTALLGLRFIGPQGGILAGGMLASCLLMTVEAHLGKTDAMLLFTITAAQFFLLRLWMDKSLSLTAALLFWLAMGAGVLIKGPLILMVVGLTMISLCLVNRSARWLAPLRAGRGIPLMLLVVLPWLVAITYKSQGAFWRESVGHDLLAKAAGGQESHGAPPGFYLGTVFVTFWPWAVLLIPAALYAWKNRRDQLVMFLLAWIIPSWIVFEAVPTKLLHYTLPVFPALALLVGKMLLDGSFTFSKKMRVVVTGLGLLLVAAVVLGLPLAPKLAFESAPSLPLLVLGFSLLALAVVFVLNPSKRLWLPLVGLMAFYGSAYHFLLPQTDAIWMSRQAQQLVEPYRADCPGAVDAAGYNEPSLVFLLGTSTRLLATPDVISDDKCRLMLVESRVLGDLDPAQALGQVRGFNTAKGDKVTLYLFRHTGRAP